LYKLPMIFPGQASQSVGMARDLADRPGPAADFLARVDGILGHDLTTLMYEGPAETLTETWNCQPAILAHSTAVVLELRAMGIEPAIVAGHSLGEFSAAVAVGALTPEEGLRLVRRRGELMFAAGRERPGTMAAVMGLSAERVVEICAEVSAREGVVVLANHNSSQQIAVSGEVGAVAAAGEALKEAGARRVVPLNVSGAFHSPLLEGAAAEFAGDLEAASVSDPCAPLVANVSATPVDDAATLLEGFRRQLTSPVLWHDGLARMVADGGQRVFLEVGPGRVLSNMARREHPDTTFLPVGTAEDLDGLMDKLSALPA